MKPIKYNNPLDLFFNDEFLNWPVLPFERKFQKLPAVNITEDENGYSVDLAVPGMKKEDFEIKLDENVLTINAEVKDESEEKGKDYTRREFSFSSFSRSFTLPENKVSDKDIKARYENGVLTISLPKKEEAKPQAAKMIEIS